MAKHQKRFDDAATAKEQKALEAAEFARKYPDIEGGGYYGAAPQMNMDHFYPKAQPLSGLDDLADVQQSQSAGLQARKDPQVRDLNHLISDSYFGEQVEEEAFEGASEAGFASESEDGDEGDVVLELMAQKEGASAHYDGGRIDAGRLNVVDEHFTPFNELADESLPLSAVAGEGGGSRAAARAAALAGPNADWANRRDLPQLPFSRGGLEPTTRTRNLPANDEQREARKQLGLSRARFNETASPGARLRGPQHAGTPGGIHTPQPHFFGAKSGGFSAERSEQALLRVAMRDSVYGAWQPPGAKLYAAPTMGGVPGAAAYGGEIMEADEASETMPDDGLANVPVHGDYFAKPEPEAPAAEDVTEGSSVAAVEDDFFAKFAAGGFAADNAQGQSKAAIKRRAKYEKNFARARAARAKQEGAGKPGFFSRLGSGLAKAARVVGNGLSSLASGVSSLFGFGRGSRGAATTSTFDPAERASDARMEYAQENYERQQEEQASMRPGEAELIRAINDPYNAGIRAQMDTAGIDFRNRHGDDELAQLQRMMSIDDDPVGSAVGGSQPEPEQSARWLPEAQDHIHQEQYFPEPKEAVDARIRARRKAELPSPESYTQEQVDAEPFMDSRMRRFERYQREASAYARGDGNVPYQGSAEEEDRHRIGSEFFKKFWENPRLSFGPYAQNRQFDVSEARANNEPNPLYPQEAPQVESPPEAPAPSVPPPVDVAEPTAAQLEKQRRAEQRAEAKKAADLAKQEKAEAKRRAALKKKYPRLYEDVHPDVTEYANYTKEVEEYNRSAKPEAKVGFLSEFEYTGMEQRKDPQHAASQPNGILSMKQNFFYPEEAPQRDLEPPAVGQASGEQAQNAFTFNEGENFNGAVSMNILEDYAPSSSQASAQPKSPAVANSGAGLIQEEPAAQVQVPVPVPPPSKGVINLPANAGKKAKLVGPQPSRADKKEAARLLQANNAKIAENAENNARTGYKVKKFLGLAQDQRVDPELDGSSLQEAAEAVMLQRLDREARMKAKKK